MKKFFLMLTLAFFSIPHLLISAHGEISTTQKNAKTNRYGNPAIDSSDIRRLTSDQEVDLQKYNNGIQFLVEILFYIGDLFYKEIDITKCAIELAMGGISECTDRYSYYLNPEERKAEQEIMLDGKMAGIGIALDVNTEGGFRILQVYENSPASKAGLMENDLIMAIAKDAEAASAEWISMKKMPIDRAILLIRGKSGTKLKLLTFRGDERKEVEIIRGIVKIPFLVSKIVKEKIGYVKIREFYGEVSEQFRSAMEKLYFSGAQVVIVDLRNNPGGKMNSALDMSALFSKAHGSHATILYVREREGILKDMTVDNRYVGQFLNKKLIIIQNGGSASASEIFAGYAQKEAGAIVIGEKSYGKGIIQSLIPLTNGGMIHLTTAEYFIGKKFVKVHGVGITPDIEVKQVKPYKTEADDEQLQRAILEAKKLLK